MSEALFRQFDRLTIWRRGDERAPHKPLLALWAIGRCLRGQSRLADYDVVHRALLALLRTFGPPRKVYKPQEPFWRMQKDGIWEVTRADEVPVQPNGSVTPTSLRTFKVRGGLREPLYAALRQDPDAAFAIALRIAEDHFAETLRFAVLQATLGDAEPGLQASWPDRQLPILVSLRARRVRNPDFRNKVLRSYGHRCAVCNYSFEFPIGQWPALEAAHIRWHSHLGPDIAGNGLSLCALHHELFDWGIFTIRPGSLRIQVAGIVLERVPEGPVTELHERQLRIVPKRDADRPVPGYLDWHRRNVFRDT